MDQADQLHQIKETLLRFPQFLQDVLKKPLLYVEQEVSMSWLSILLYTFITQAVAGFLFTVFSFHFSGIFAVLIFGPFQVLLAIGVFSFVIQFILEKMGHAHITFFQVYKLVALINIMMTAFALPFLLVSSLTKSTETSYFIQAAAVVAQAFLAYRGFKKQFLIPEKKALAVVCMFTILFLIPIGSSYVNGYHARQEVREARKVHEQLMKKSIEEIEKDLNQNSD